MSEKGGNYPAGKSRLGSVYKYGYQLIKKNPKLSIFNFNNLMNFPPNAPKKKKKKNRIYTRKNKNWNWFSCKKFEFFGSKIK